MVPVSPAANPGPRCQQAKQEKARHPKLTMMSAIRNRMSIDPLSDSVRLVRFMFVVAYFPIGEIDRPGAEVRVYFMGMSGYG